MFSEKEITTLLTLLGKAPTTYAEAHNFRPTVDKIMNAQMAIKAGSSLVLLDADEVTAITEFRKRWAEAKKAPPAPSPSGPTIPNGALEASQT